MNFPRFSGFQRQHAYQTVCGIRSDALRYLTAAGVDSAAAGNQLCSLGTMFTQDLADVSFPNGQRLVVGCPTMHVGESGSAKSAIQLLLHARVISHLNGLPQPTGIALVEEVNREALLDTLGESVSVSVLSTEGGQMTRLLTGSSATLVKVIDGEGVHHARRDEKRRVQVSQDVRCSIHLQIQRERIQAYAEHIRASNHESGVPNRMLWSMTEGMPLNNPMNSVDPHAQPIQSAIKRVEELLAASLRRDRGRPRPRLVLDRLAKQLYLEIDHSERAFALREPHAYMRTYRVRHAERSLREAGSHHVFEYGAEGEISLATLQMAHQLDLDSIKTYADLLYSPPRLTKQQQYAVKLEDALRQLQLWSGTHLHLTDLKAWAPNAGLSPGQVDAAIPLLCEQGKLVAGKKFVVWYPDGFGSQLRIGV